MNNHSFLGLPLKFISVYCLFRIGYCLFIYYPLFSMDYWNFSGESATKTYEFLSIIIYNQIQSLLTNGLIYFLIAVFFTQKYRLTANNNTSLGIVIGVFYCILLFILWRFLIPEIYVFFRYLYPNDQWMVSINARILSMILHILLILLVFRLFKPKSNMTQSESRFDNNTLQKTHATILACFMLFFPLLLPMIFINPLQYLQQFTDILSILNQFEKNLLFTGLFLLNAIIVYNIVVLFTRRCFSGVIDKIKWGALLATMLIVVIMMSIMEFIIYSLTISTIMHLTNLPNLLIVMLLGVVASYIILGLSCRFAVKMLFLDSQPSSSGIVS